jgi:hypothetical protein
MSTDLEAVVRRDDDLYDLDQPVETAKSGTQAAKRAMGLLSAVESTSEAPAAKPGAIPNYDDASAIKAVKGCKTIKQLEGLADEIRKDFSDTGRELPIAVEAALNDRKEALAQE